MSTNDDSIPQGLTIGKREELKLLLSLLYEKYQKSHDLTEKDNCIKLIKKIEQVLNE